jgi:hypothetical protein
MWSLQSGAKSKRRLLLLLLCERWWCPRKALEQILLGIVSRLQTAAPAPPASSNTVPSNEHCTYVYVPCRCRLLSICSVVSRSILILCYATYAEYKQFRRDKVQRTHATGSSPSRLPLQKPGVPRKSA